jgi:hypothetical protein
MRKIQWEKNKKKAFCGVSVLVIILNISNISFLKLIDEKIGLMIGFFVILLIGILSEIFVKLGKN